MNPWINYHHLFYFMTIAETGSVSKAAQKLRLGQPTLSAQLKQFEENLGVQLFERQHKKLILSEQGRVALDYARSIFKMGNEMYEVLHDRLKPSRISVHIGALDSIPKQTMLELAQSAYRLGPCSLTLVEGKLDELIRELSAHRIDLVLSNHLPLLNETKSLQHRSIVKRQVSFYGAPKFKSLRKDFPRSLQAQPCVLPTYDSKIRYDLEHWSKVHDLSLDIIAESQDIALKKLMAINAMALIPAASHTVTRQILRGELIEIGPLQGIYEELFLLSAQRRMANPVASTLMKEFSV